MVKQASIGASGFSPAQQLSCYTDDTFIAHLRSTLFVVSISDNSSSRPINETWPGFLAQRELHPLASQCLVSLSQAYFGVQHGAHDVSVRGTALYVRSLGRLYQDLDNAQAGATDDTLLSVMILSLYEMLVLSTNNGWIDHALGLGRLIESRGPESFAEPGRHLLFESNRLIIILASLAASKPTFLSRHEWKTQPWPGQSGRKNRVHYLLDMFADLATLKALLLDPHDDKAALLFKNTVTQMICDLNIWRAAWDAVNNSDVTEVQNQSPHSRETLPTLLGFPSMFVANAVCLYDAIFIQAVRLLKTSASSMSLGVYSTQMQAAATEICRASDYQMQNADYMTGQFLVLFPLRMAYLGLESSESPLKGWIEETLLGFTASRKAWGVARKLNAYGGSVSLPTTSGQPP